MSGGGIKAGGPPHACQWSSVALAGLRCRRAGQMQSGVAQLSNRWCDLMHLFLMEEVRLVSGRVPMEHSMPSQMFPLCLLLTRKPSIACGFKKYNTFGLWSVLCREPTRFLTYATVFLFHCSERFKISVSWLCIPHGTDDCCDKISINSAQFSVELTRQLISISVSLTSSALDLCSCDLARSQLGVMSVCVGACTRLCDFVRAQYSEPYSCERSECKAMMGLR